MYKLARISSYLSPCCLNFYEFAIEFFELLQSLEVFVGRNISHITMRVG